MPPVVIAGALIVPAGALTPSPSPSGGEGSVDAQARVEVERLATKAVLAAERRLGREPRDGSADKLGYDIESKVPEDGRLLFIEVKGRKGGADTVTLTRNEILSGLNMPDDFVLALVEVNGAAGEPRYIRCPFRQEPDLEVTSVNPAFGRVYGQPSRQRI